MTLMAGRERRSMMTGAQAAHCGSVSAISLGLPVSTAIPEAKGTLPKALFVGKAPISGKLKQRLVNEIESITMLALARSANTGLADGKLIPEVLVIGLKLTAKATGIPNEVIDLIAGQFYISKYYMMRLFKQETGYTLGQYISQKRLLLAKELLSSGVPGTQVCYDCGFKDYSTFSRAYKQLFGVTPSGRTYP